MEFPPLESEKGNCRVPFVSVFHAVVDSFKTVSVPKPEVRKKRGKKCCSNKFQGHELMSRVWPVNT